MILKFDKEKLDRILYDFSKITGVSIAIVDRELDYIASSGGAGDMFCRILQSRDRGHRCRCSDRHILKKCTSSKKVEMHICHAGLCDLTVPLVSDGELIAYIILGRIKGSGSFDDIFQCISWYDKDKELLREEYSKLICYDADGIKSITNIAVAVASYILCNGVIRPQYNLLAEKAVKYIDENLSQKIKVEELCRYLGVSKNLLYDNFRTAFGCTVNDYITEKRIHRAITLLSDTEKPIGDIADGVGIFNHTYFSRLITQKVGCSPLEYRKRILKGEA